MFRGLGGIIYKELIQVMRDPASLLVTIGMPVMQLIIYGYGIDTEVRNVATVVFDQDRSPASRDFVERLEATGLYFVEDYVDSSDALNGEIIADRAKVGLSLPPNFQRELNAGRPAQVQVLIDGSNNTVASQTLATVQNLGLAISAERMGFGLSGAGGLPLEVRPRLLFNPSLRSANFFVPGLVGILLFLSTMLLTAFAIVREREVGTLEQLMVTPVTRSALMLGKVLPYVVMGLLQMLVVLFFAQVIFKVRIEGNFFLLIGLALVFVFSSLGLGLIISTIARTQLQAMLMAFTIMLPSILLSGFLFPRESMPAPIFWVSSALPVTYFIEILRGIVLRGAGFDVLWDETAILAGMGVLLLSVAALRFQKTVT
jgi:ABC transporter DrrB family efflux protein